MNMKVQNSLNSAGRPVGLIIRQKGPNNLEMPFDQLGDFITPTELFYIRSHFPTPELDPISYQLTIRGAVHTELTLSYADIRAMPSRTSRATVDGSTRRVSGLANGVWVKWTVWRSGRFSASTPGRRLRW